MPATAKTENSNDPISAKGGLDNCEIQQDSKGYQPENCETSTGGMGHVPSVRHDGLEFLLSLIDRLLLYTAVLTQHQAAP